MKLTHIYRAINEAADVASEEDELSGFLDTITQLEQHTKQRKVLEPGFSKEDLLSDIKREEPDIDLKKAEKMADFVFRHLEEDYSTQNKIKESTAQDLEVGDFVKITGDVDSQGKTGTIDSFGTDKKFVIVNLNDTGLRSFHSSDVSSADEDDEELEEAEVMRRASQEELDLYRSTIKQMADKITKLNAMYVVAKKTNNTELMKKIRNAMAKIAVEKATISDHLRLRQDGQVKESVMQSTFKVVTLRNNQVYVAKGSVMIECADLSLARSIVATINKTKI